MPINIAGTVIVPAYTLSQNILPDSTKPVESLTTSSRLISDTKPLESVSHTQ